MLETRLQALEAQKQAELASLQGEKEKLQHLLGRQNSTLISIQRSLLAASSNSSLLQSQQRQLLEFLQRLVHFLAQGPGEQGLGCPHGVAGCGQARESGPCRNSLTFPHKWKL